MLVRLKREIIPVGLDGVEPIPEASPKIAPELLKQWLDEKRPIALLDTRNDYEVELGTFENAIDLKLKTFREFPKRDCRHTRGSEKATGGDVLHGRNSL